MNIEKLLLYYSDILKAQSKIVNNEYTIFVDSLIECKGKLVIFGMGKSGLVGKKYLAPLQALECLQYLLIQHYHLLWGFFSYKTMILL